MVFGGGQMARRDTIETQEKVFAARTIEMSKV
jgi:hypothetical protein